MRRLPELPDRAPEVAFLLRGLVAHEDDTLDRSSPVTTILVMSETRSLADVKAHLSEIVDLVEGQHERVIITRNGRPAAVIISPDDLEGLEETLDLLSTPGAVEEIRAAESEIAEGSVLTAAELRAKYLNRD